MATGTTEITTETTAETTDRNLAVLEAAFLPLETQTSTQENGNVQISVIDDGVAILIDERPLYGLHTDRVLRDWIADTRKRLEDLGYELDSMEIPAKADR